MVILCSYDVEAGSVGEAIAGIKDGPERYPEAVDPASTPKALKIIAELHRRYEVPFTLFITGKTLLQSVESVRDVMSSCGKLVDVQQHTYSHVLFKDIRYEPSPGQRVLFRAAPYELIQHEVRSASEAFRRTLNVECKGMRTPFCYWQGLKGKPELLKLLWDNGMRFVSSFGRNENDGHPTPWVQPYTYAREGFPELVELPIQNWFDVLWYDTNGWTNTEGFKKHNRANIDYVHGMNIVWGVVFHEWVLVKNDEPRTKVVEDFLQYARSVGEQLHTNLGFSEIVRSGKWTGDPR